MPRAIVTGGAGFIGSHLTDFLIGAGYHVTVLDDFSTGKRVNLLSADLSGRLRVNEGSILSREDVRKSLQGCELVFHLAVRSVRHSIGEPEDNHHVNASGTLNVLEEARREGIGRFVYCSSSEVYGNAPDKLMVEDVTVCKPVTVYGGAKLAGEYYANAYRSTYGLPTVVVRPFNAYGPRSHMHGQSGEVIPRFAARILNGQSPIVFGDGSHSRDFTFVTEIAEGIGRAGMIDDAVGATINIAYGRTVSILDVALDLAAECGRPDIKPKFVKGRPGDVIALHANVNRCTELLRFKPQIEFTDGLKAYISWLKTVEKDVDSLLSIDQINWHIPR